MATPHEILEQLKKVNYPGYTRDIVSFGIVRDIEVSTSAITVKLAPGGARAEAVTEIMQRVRQVVRDFTGETNVEIAFEREPQSARARARGPEPRIPGVKHIIAVASGKGGVGKSTVAVNLALAFRAAGYRVGLIDADVYGPSVPVMLGLHQRPETRDDDRIVPIEKFGIKIISFGLFLGRAQPVIWRGPMLNKLLTQFLHEVEWGELDFLVLDLPPGTGDAHLTIVQQIRLSGGVIVTTPQDVALLDVERGIKMFQQVNAPVLGVIENMSFHLCSGCGDRSEIFGHGGAAELAKKFAIPFLGEIPLVEAIREGSDTGQPIVAAQPDHPQSRAFRAIARDVVAQLERQRPAAELPVIH